MLAPFAAVAGLAIATERRGEVRAGAIDQDLAGADAVGNRMGFLVRALNIACETVNGIVGHLDGLVDRVIGQDAEHGPEDFLARDGHVIGDIRKHGRAGEVALVEAFRTARATGNEGCALFDAFLDQVLNLLILVAVGDRADSAGRSFGGHRHLHGFSGCLGNRDGLLLLVLLHEHARRGVTALARIGHHVHDAAGNGLLQISRRQNNVRALAAEFLGNALHRRGSGLGHQHAGAGRAGEAHHVHIGVGRHHGANARAVAVDEVEHAFRYAGLVQDFGKDHRVERRDFRRLQHHGAACGQRGRHFAGDLVQRPVPGRDECADANRLFAQKGGAFQLFPFV